METGYQSNFIFNVVNRNRTSIALLTKPETSKLGKYNPNYESVEKSVKSLRFSNYNRSVPRQRKRYKPFCMSGDGVCKKSVISKSQ